MRSFFKKRDLIVILALLVVAGSGFAHYYFTARDTGQAEIYAEIFLGGTLAKTVYLDEYATFSLEELPQVVFEVRDGRISFISSDCPDKSCIHFGPQGAPSGFAACLPNNVLLWVRSPDGDGPDVVVN